MRKPLDENGKPCLTYAQIKENLNEPIEEKYLRFFEQDKNTKVPFINITDLKDLMDQRAGIWTHEIESLVHQNYTTEKYKDKKNLGSRDKPEMVDVDVVDYIGELMIIVKVSIYALDGIFTMSANGCENTPLKGWGDPSSNSFKMGFNRACEGHGLGRELKRKDEQVKDRKRDQRKQSSQTQETPKIEKLTEELIKSYIDKGAAIEKICNSKYGTTWDKLNPDQEKDFIRVLEKMKFK